MAHFSCPGRSFLEAVGPPQHCPVSRAAPPAQKRVGSPSNKNSEPNWTVKMHGRSIKTRSMPIKYPNMAPRRQLLKICDLRSKVDRKVLLLEPTGHGLCPVPMHAYGVLFWLSSTPAALSPRERKGASIVHHIHNRNATLPAGLHWRNRDETAPCIYKCVKKKPAVARVSYSIDRDTTTSTIETTLNILDIDSRESRR